MSGGGRLQQPGEPVAVVGMACRFPGAPDIESFWRLLRDGGNSFGGGDVLEPPAHIGQVRKPELAKPLSVAHGRRDLEFGNVDRKAGPERLYQRFLHSPEAKEKLSPALLAGASQPCLLRRSKRLFHERIQIAASAERLHVHAQPAASGQRDQPMPPAVTDVETDRSGLPVHASLRLSVLPSLERQFAVGAVQLPSKKHPQRGPAQCEFAPRRIEAEGPPAAPFLVVEQAERRPFPFGMRLEVNMEDIGAARPAKWPPPKLAQRKRLLTFLGEMAWHSRIVAPAAPLTMRSNFASGSKKTREMRASWRNPRLFACAMLRIIGMDQRRIQL